MSEAAARTALEPTPESEPLDTIATSPASLGS
jgi:hypothetical protein